VSAWIRVEAASKFAQGPTKLPAAGRPGQVGLWISRARWQRGVADPVVTNPGAYANEWQAWWDSLQPEWRVREADGAWSNAEYRGKGQEWGPLTQWGVNGTLSIVASLYFWGCRARGDADLEEVWETAVLDVLWMLEGMAVFFEKFRRR
ncbi:hypothetical protein C8R44DRAFT_645827, partial [Mycena epipterygia]